MENKVTQMAYLEITSREDEKKWKEFLSHYFPNHYAKEILERNLVVETGKGCHISKRIGIGVNGYGWLSGMCLFYGGPEKFKNIKNFEEFKETEIYKEIVKRGPTLKEGEPEVIHSRKGNTWKKKNS